MTSRVRVGIAGTGSQLPDRVLQNRDFEKWIDTSDEWIVQRTGIRERRWVAEGEKTSDMCLSAARRALDASGVKPEELDLVIVGTLTPDFLLPACACLVQDRLGAKNAGAFDVSAACTGFLTALHTAEAFIASGRAKRVLAIGAESLSRFLDIKDRSSCIIFGDGAGAAVLMPWEDCRQGEILRTKLGADGSGYSFIHMKGGGSVTPPTQESVARGDHFIRLQGRETFRFAVNKMAEMIELMVQGQDPADVSLIVPHQVNQRIFEAAMERLGWGMEKLFINIDKYGNTSAASVPIALDEAVRAGRLSKEKLAVLVAFGAGLTWGGTLLRW
ncbi:MAG: ketoacyl-ACP synthase III [Planctomycetes bacterium]|jgi:3-oxoacyl-[acyl-carrier-protein] synthase-3|nr:ketoacyl-ACP synthase III [Planctomycetota bacterium]